MFRVNNDIHEAVKASKVKKWRIADWLNMKDSEFSKMLRYPLTEEEKKKILAIINELAKEG